MEKPNSKGLNEDGISARNTSQLAIRNDQIHQIEGINQISSNESFTRNEANDEEENHNQNRVGLEDENERLDEQIDKTDSQRQFWIKLVIGLLIAGIIVFVIIDYTSNK